MVVGFYTKTLQILMCNYLKTKSVPFGNTQLSLGSERDRNKLEDGLSALKDGFSKMFTAVCDLSRVITAICGWIFFHT